MTAINDLKVEFTEKGDPLTDIEKAISIFESVVGNKLPAEYGKFLRSNGNTIFLKNNLIDAKQEPSFSEIPKENMIDVLYGLNSYKLKLLDENSKYQDRIPNGLITIGTTAADDQICLGIASECARKVYYWFHEREVDNKGQRTPDFSNMFLISETFDDFIRSIRPKAEQDKQNPKIKSISLRF